MPAPTTLPTSIAAGSTGHLADTAVVHGVINGIQLAAVGQTKTAAYTLTANDSGEVIFVNSASSVAITVPVLPAGTSVELVRYGTGAVTLTASGTTLRVPTGATASPRVQYSSMSLLYRTTTEVIVGGDLT